MECVCCGYKYNENRCGFLCSYCGYNNSFKAKKKIESYRSFLLNRISNFTVKADVFSFNSEKNKFELNSNPHHLFENTITGNELFENVVWSEKWITNPSALCLEGKKCTIPISYILGDKKVETVFDIACVEMVEIPASTVIINMIFKNFFIIISFFLFYN